MTSPISTDRIFDFLRPVANATNNVVQLDRKDNTPTEKTPAPETTEKTSRPTTNSARYGRNLAANDPRANQLRTRVENDLNDGETTMTKAQFLERFGDKSIRADTKLPGVAYLDRADLNDDGVIAGRAEWEEAFKEVDIYDKNGDADSVDTSNEKVAASIASLDGAVDGAKGKRFYNDRQRTVMSSKLEAGEPHKSTAESYVDQKKDYLGRNLSDRLHKVTLGHGSSGDVDLVYDSTKNRFYKSQNGGPLIALTRSELADVKKNLAQHKPSDGTDDPVNWHYNIIYAGLFPDQADKYLPEFDF